MTATKTWNIHDDNEYLPDSAPRHIYLYRGDREIACLVGYPEAVDELTPEQARQYAAYVVRACNAHDDLLAACKMAEHAIARNFPDSHYLTPLRDAIEKAEAQQ